MGVVAQKLRSDPKIWATARKIAIAAHKRGLPWRVVVAQSILESGYYKYMVGNNPFGMKATKEDIARGKYGVYWTTEYLNGQWVRIQDKFAHFDSLDEAIERYAQLIRRVYPYAWAHRNNEREYIRGLFETGPYKYGTDPNYVAKLISVTNDIPDDLLQITSRVSPLLLLGGLAALILLGRE